MPHRMRTLVFVSVASATISIYGQQLGPPPVNPDFTGAEPSFQIRVSIPDTFGEITREIRTRSGRIHELLRTGAFAEVYLPAFEAKELALAVEARRAQIDPTEQPEAARAVKQLVRSAWLLDAFGDLGNRQELEKALKEFDSAASRLERLFPTTP